jgi:hypothetical protein
MANVLTVLGCEQSAPVSSLTLSDEQRRILFNRIVSAIENARWYPATSSDAALVAERILRAPLTPDTHNSGRE